MCIEEIQIGINYEIVVLLATLNNKTTNKISVKRRKGENTRAYKKLFCTTIFLRFENSIIPFWNIYARKARSRVSVREGGENGYLPKERAYVGFSS